MGPNFRSSRTHTVAVILVLFGWVCVPAIAQDVPGTPLPDAPSSTAQSQPAQPAANRMQSGVAIVMLVQKKSRFFPDLATNTAQLSKWDKFNLAANRTVALSTVAAVFLGSSVGQVTDRPAGYGKGEEGYAQRFGASWARAASNNLFGTFLLASLTHEDPRFFVKSNLTFKESAKYAAQRLLITRSDSGQRVVNYSGLLGPIAGETLANTYYPVGSRGVGPTFSRYAADIGWQYVGNLLRQYWPTINHKLLLTPEPSQPTAASHRGSP
ncbi:MAG TPA: hypothetical protein VE779_12575 [Candidatus Angelobacter sp.]|nr:hypothetical protein [Candidatus Angelobacter sp.]